VFFWEFYRCNIVASLWVVLMAYRELNVLVKVNLSMVCHRSQLHYANEESDDVIRSTTKEWKIESKTYLEMLEQCSSNLAPEMYIIKETKWDLLCHCHDNTLSSSLFLSKTKYSHLQPFKVGLHNTKTSISLKQRKIFQKGKWPSSLFCKVFRRSSHCFSLYRHFKQI